MRPGIVRLRCSCGIVMRSPEGCVYNHEAVRHFLELERERAGRHGSPILVVIIALRHPQHRGAATLPDGIFPVLWRGLREVDVVGWLRPPSLAGAVLAAGTRPPTTDDSRAIARRLQGMIRTCLPAAVADLVRIRVLQVRPH